jgi:cytochrome b561
MFVVHRSMDIFIATLISIHVVPALYHHFILRERVLQRMVSG